MANLYQGLARGPIDHISSSLINIVANEADMEMGSVVKLAAPPATELLPRADKTDAITDKGYGIVVGGDNDGVYGDGGASPADDTTKASLLAGDAIVICTQGRCLARLAENCSLGDALSPTAAAALQLADTATHAILCIALQAGSAGDIIAVDVQREGAF
jgi:uncharacterized membrane protein